MAQVCGWILIQTVLQLFIHKTIFLKIERKCERNGGLNFQVATHFHPGHLQPKTLFNNKQYPEIGRGKYFMLQCTYTFVHKQLNCHSILELLMTGTPCQNLLFHWHKM